MRNLYTYVSCHEAKNPKLLIYKWRGNLAWKRSPQDGANLLGADGSGWWWGLALKKGTKTTHWREGRKGER